MSIKTIEAINYELKVDGFSVLRSSHHGFNGLDPIIERFRSSISQDFNNPYRAQIFRDSDLDNNKNLDIKRYNDFCLGMISKMSTKQKRLDSIFQTLDTTNSTHIAQAPHFDRIPTLKFMLYANDLTAESGAFCLSSGSHIWTKEKFKGSTRRPSHGTKGFLEDSRTIPEPILSRLSSIEGEAGTIIIFDTDCIHHQGIVKYGEARLVRAHYRDRSSTSRNFINRAYTLTLRKLIPG